MNAFGYWRELQLASRDRADRLDPSIERARWRTLAGAYDRNALHTSAPEFARRVAEEIQTGESVLEIGPGTGGFTVPVAARASRVLAVDLSEAMLGVLRDRLDAGRVRNVELRQGEWPEVGV
ncbi:MAG: class I SAM-dependent methyltransferase, partial [Dehalococcoidia bacterium]